LSFVPIFTRERQESKDTENHQKKKTRRLDTGREESDILSIGQTVRIFHIRGGKSLPKKKLGGVTDRSN